MSFNVVIPARYHSSRLPGKPLAKINNKPMILHVVQQAIESGAAKVVVATDHSDIFNCVCEAGHTAVMTGKHNSGTDRVAEAVKLFDWKNDVFVINIQGDEPLMPSTNIRQLYHRYQHSRADMYTLCEELQYSKINDPTIVKVVPDGFWNAMYFSRANIPHNRDGMGCHMQYRHLGIYGYRVEFLDRITNLPPPLIEEDEKLEQLRALWYGFTIKLDIAHELTPPGVDTPTDLERVRKEIEDNT